MGLRWLGWFTGLICLKNRLLQSEFSFLSCLVISFVHIPVMLSTMKLSPEANVGAMLLDLYNCEPNGHFLYKVPSHRYFVIANTKQTKIPINFKLYCLNGELSPLRILSLPCSLFPHLLTTSQSLSHCSDDILSPEVVSCNCT